MSFALVIVLGKKAPAHDTILSGKESGLLLSILFPYNINYVNLHQGWLMAEESVS